jgi:hypothetical protein
MPDNRLLELALKGLEAERAKIDDEIAQIKNQLGYRPSASANSVGSYGQGGIKKRRTMSPEARRRISEGMKRRYAALRKAAKKAAG